MIMSSPMAMHGKYVHSSCLRGNRGTITCLSATDDRRLASGGDQTKDGSQWLLMICTGSDGVRLWDLKRNIKLRIPGGSGQRGATTALTWVRRDDEVEDGLIYGTQGGYLVGWKETRGAETFVCIPKP